MESAIIRDHVEVGMSRRGKQSLVIVMVVFVIEIVIIIVIWLLIEDKSIFGNLCEIAKGTFCNLDLGLKIYNAGAIFTVNVWDLEAICTGVYFIYKNV